MRAPEPTRPSAFQIVFGRDRNSSVRSMTRSTRPTARTTSRSPSIQRTDVRESGPDHAKPHGRHHGGDHDRQADRADDVFDLLATLTVVEPSRRRRLGDVGIRRQGRRWRDRPMQHGIRERRGGVDHFAPLLLSRPRLPHNVTDVDFRRRSRGWPIDDDARHSASRVVPLLTEVARPSPGGAREVRIFVGVRHG